jgi:hypothetical protein
MNITCACSLSRSCYTPVHSHVHTYSLRHYVVFMPLTNAHAHDHANAHAYIHTHEHVHAHAHAHEHAHAHVLARMLIPISMSCKL